MRWRRLLWASLPCRWWRSAVALPAGVRVHPSATLLGRAGQFALGEGSVLDARVRIDLGEAGRLQTGRGVWLAHDTEIETSTSVVIGDGSTLQRRCSLNGSVRVGRGCILAPDVFISSGTHPFRTPSLSHLPIREQERRLREAGQAADDRPVWIQDDCWLGVHAVLMPGVVVGKGSVVGANAVVTKAVAPYSVVAGMPARVVGQRLHWRPPPALRLDRDEDLVYVLSGKVVGRAGQPCAIGVFLDEPLLAAVDAPAGRARVRYEAAGPLEVMAGGELRSLPAGKGMLEFPVRAAAQGGPGAMVELSVVSVASVVGAGGAGGAGHAAELLILEIARA